MALLKILMLFCLLDLPISDKDMLMFPTIIVGFSISPHVLSIFVSHILMLHMLRTVMFPWRTDPFIII